MKGKGDRLGLMLLRSCPLRMPGLGKNTYRNRGSGHCILSLPTPTQPLGGLSVPTAMCTHQLESTFLGLRVVPSNMLR